MAKLNYQKASRDRHLSRQPIVNTKKSKVFANPILKRRLMPFGKYKNYEFRDLPFDYLKWAILNLNNDHLLDDLIRELQRRDSSYIVLSQKKTGP